MSRVIGIAGPAGAGKSTLVRALHEKTPNSATLFFDSFPVQMPEDLRQWLQDGADFNEWRAPALVSALREVAADSDLVWFEAPLGRAHVATGELIDHLVFVDVPLEIALARFAAREVDRGREGVSMLAGYLGLYEVVLRDVYAAQRDQVLPRADDVIDGRQHMEEIVIEVLKSAGV